MSAAPSLPQGPQQAAPTVAEQRRQGAEDLLFCTVDTVDAASGARLQHRVETTHYRDYCALRSAHDAARAEYTAAYKEAQKTPIGRRTWPHLAAQLRTTVDQAHDRWRSAGGQAFADAEALLAAAAGTAWWHPLR